jgi:hypothetical protein
MLYIPSVLLVSSVIFVVLTDIFSELGPENETVRVSGFKIWQHMAAVDEKVTTGLFSISEIAGVVRCIERMPVDGSDMTAFVVRVLQRIALERPNLSEVVRSGGFEAMLNVLETEGIADYPNITRIAMNIIGNIAGEISSRVAHDPGLRIRWVRMGDIHGRRAHQCADYFLFGVQKLTRDDAETRELLGAQGVCRLAVALLKQHGGGYPGVAEEGGKAIVALSRLASNKAAFIQEGAASVLTRVLSAQGSNAKVSEHCNSALASLRDG